MNAGRKAAVLGSPVAHSRSPQLHLAAYRALGLDDWTYDRIECTADELPSLVSGFGPEWVGVSVTMPGKFAALQFADEHTQRAGLVGSANTLVRTAAGWRADNTDVDGVAGALGHVRRSMYGCASMFLSFLSLSKLPLALIGVMLALLFWRSTLNVFSMIGLVMLMGLVTKNAILLVDFANHGLKAGLSVPEALLQAGQIRMRPILMTTAAMVFGMMPLALAINDGGEIQAPMGRAIIGGVITSTLLTLVVVPVLWSYLVRKPKATPKTAAVAVANPREALPSADALPAK